MARRNADGECECVDGTTFDDTDCIVDAGLASETCPAGKFKSPNGNCDLDCDSSCLSCTVE